MESVWSHVFNTYYYVFFKKDPCKTCLVKPCCNEICEEKHLWNFYKVGNPELVIIACGIIYLILVVVAIIVKIFENVK